MSAPDNNTAARTFAALGQLVVEWNLAESWLRQLLFLFAGEYPGNLILTTELGTTGVIQALQTFANDFVSEEYKAALLHATNYFERVREYRNHYVHGITYVGEEAGNMGFIEATSSKGRLVESTHKVGPDEIAKITGYCFALTSYLNAVATRHHGPWSLPAPGPWPDKPPLPDRLAKPRRYPPPRSTQPAT